MTPFYRFFHIHILYIVTQIFSIVCVRIFRTILREVSRNTKIYNLDAAISAGYRVNSSRAAQFRAWAASNAFSSPFCFSSTYYAAKGLFRFALLLILCYGGWRANIRLRRPPKFPPLWEYCGWLP